ncbi:MAG: DUF1499 domain-containing protein [Candidatus Nitrospinota bacterium M3_3B_026]
MTASSLDWFTKNRVETSPDHEDRALRPRFFPAPPATALDAARRAAESLPSWKLASADKERVRAERATGLFQFIDDIEISVVAHPAGAIISARSGSRVGKGDFGQNKRNIVELFEAVGVELMDEKPPKGYGGLLFCHYTAHPFEKTAPLFFDPEFLPKISPSWTGIRIVSKPDPVKIGARMRLSVAGMFTWEVQFIEWNPPRAFTDRQVKGPFEDFVHRHTFEAKAGGTVVCDRVHYKHMFGQLGAAAGSFLTGGRLAALLAQRGEMLDAYLESGGI